MSSAFPPGPGRPGPSGPDGPRQGPPTIGRRRRPGALAPTLAILGALVFALVLFAEVWTDVLWFGELGFLEVLRTRLLTQIALFAVAAVIMAVAVWGSLTIAFRSRPVYAPTTPGQEALDRYREQLEPLRRLVGIAVPALLGLFAGSAAAGQWQTVVLWFNRQPFGETDAEFGLDLGFYVFSLPMLEFLIGFATAVLLLSGIAAVLTHYLYGGVRISGAGERTTREARLHLGLLGAAFLLLRAAGYFVERYSLMTDETNDLAIAGPLYTDVNAVLPARLVLAVASALVAALFLYAAFRGSWRLPGIGVGVLVLTAVAAGGIWPQVLQRFQVEPNEQSLEAPYVERNVDATRTAYGVDGIEVRDYDAELTAERGQLAEDARTIPGIRLLDPNIVAPTFQQLEQIRQFYAFPESLDIDRYDIDGETQDTVVALREVNLQGLPAAQRNWVNDHTVYTHGFGVVAAYGNRRTAGGEPVFFQSGIPNTGELGDFQPRIYFGEFSPPYSIVGAPDETDTVPQELDYLDETAPNGQRKFTYDGEGGVAIGDFFTQLLFAIKFRAEEIVLTDTVNSESRILFDRGPRERVEKVAPWLTIDGDPYPAVIDDKVVWILDGYTTSNQYPYSTSTTLEEATVTSITETSSAVATLLPERVNYVRNSVKATVDAYTGEVVLYAWDEDDPLLEAWGQAFPGSVQPIDDISGDLMSHLRYPQDLFKVQRTLLERYHVQSPEAFYTGADFWSVPDDPTLGEEISALQPPFYLTLEMPGQESPSFSLTSTFIPTQEGEADGRNILTGFLAVDADAGGDAGAPREGYGQLRLLQIRSEGTVAGPGQVQNDFNANPVISQELNVLRLGESETISGNLLTLPIGGGLLYVQPVYVQSSGGTQYPILQRVLVAFGDEIGFGETLNEALDDIFDGDAGADAADADLGTVPDATPPGVPDSPTDPQAVDPDDSLPTPVAPIPDDSDEAPIAGTPEGRLDQALQDARAAITESQAALAANDFAAYGEAQARLTEAIERAIEAEGQIESADGGAAEATAEPTE